MVFKNVTDLMKRHTALFVILLISQIFALLSIFFVFGVFQNNLYELCDNHDSKSLEATIDNQKITSDDISIGISSSTMVIDFYDHGRRRNTD